MSVGLQLLENILGILRLSRFARDMERVAVLDGFLQFCENPTSATAGFGIEENYAFIKSNLQKRYGLSNEAVEEIIIFLKESIKELVSVNSDIYFWRKEIIKVIKAKFIEEILGWYNSLYEGLTDNGKLKFVFLLRAFTITEEKKGGTYAIHLHLREIFTWYRCFFDKNERLQDFEFIDLAIKFGLGSILYYRSSRGNESAEFRPFTFLKILSEKFKDKTSVDERYIKDFFDHLSLSNVKIIEAVLQQDFPVVDARLYGQITQTKSLIVEASNSFWAISPFSSSFLHEFIASKKLELIRHWKEKIEFLLNSFVEATAPFAELRHFRRIEAAEFWQILFTGDPEKPSVTIIVFLAPYLFPLSSVKTIANELFITPCHLRLVFLLEETMPTIQEEFKHFIGKNLIFLFDKKEEAFYIYEKSTTLPNEQEFQIQNFLSKFIPLLCTQHQIKTLSRELREYIEILEYFHQFPNLIMLKIKIPQLERKLRVFVRAELKKMFGEQWQEQIKSSIESWKGIIRKLEETAKRREDKPENWDFLDGATLGDLAQIMNTHLKLDSVAKNLLEFILKQRNIIEHPIKEFKNDIDQQTYNRLNIALEYLSNVTTHQE
jgi:hypothetical protein